MKAIGAAARVVTWRVRSVVAIGLIAGAIAAGGGGFAAGQGLEASYTLRGAVVNSVTGEPIHNALVTLSVDGTRSVLTAADGSFEFRDLKETGNRAIFAARPGYFSPQLVRYSQHSTSSSTIPIKIGPDQPPLGVGESASVPSAAAIANAIYDATGVRFRELPFTPERILAGLRDQQGATQHALPGATARTQDPIARPAQPNPFAKRVTENARRAYRRSLRRRPRR